jgi:preprotein translocase subunit SecE
MSTSDASQQANRSGMDPIRLVVIFYLLGGLVLTLFLDRVLGDVWDKAGLPNPTLIEGPDWKLTTIVSLALTVGVVALCYFQTRIRQLGVEVASELMRVTWPSWQETRVSTFAVVVASIVAGVILFGIDTLAYKMMVDWLPTLWGKLNG